MNNAKFDLDVYLIFTTKPLQSTYFMPSLAICLSNWTLNTLNMPHCCQNYGLFGQTQHFHGFLTQDGQQQQDGSSQ